MANGYWAGDAIVQSIEAAGARASANNELAKAEKYHRGTVAQLAAALTALKQLAPEHPLNLQIVLDQIDQDGERTRSFQEAWQLGHCPKAILSRLVAEHEKSKMDALSKINALQIVCKRAFWSSKEVFMIGKTKFPNESEARNRKEKLVALVTTAGLGECMDLAALMGRLDS